MEKWIPLVALVVFPFFWCGICQLVSFLGGWSRLATKYRTEEAANGTTFHMRSGKVGMTEYKSCLTLCISESGIRLSVLFPFRFAHPPLFIPWSEFHDIHEKHVVWVFPFLQANIGKPTVVTILLPLWVRDYFPSSNRFLEK